MAVVSHTYTKFTLSLATKLMNLVTDNIGVLLMSAYTVGATQDTAQFVSDVLGVGTETTGTNYARQNLVGVSLTETGHIYTLTCTQNPTWNNATFNAAFALFYDSTPSTDATRPVISYWDFGGTRSPSGIPFVLTVATLGVTNLIAS